MITSPYLQRVIKISIVCLGLLFMLLYVVETVYAQSSGGWRTTSTRSGNTVTTTSSSYGSMQGPPHVTTRRVGNDRSSRSSNDDDDDNGRNASAAPSANISAGNCSIPAGRNSCETAVSWSSTNTTGRSIQQDNNQFSTAASGNTNRTIPRGNSTFVFLNDGVQLASRTVSASCASGSEWSSTANQCAVRPTVSVNVNATTPTWVGQTVTVNWNTSNAEVCTASGAWSGSRSVNGSFSAPVTISGDGTQTFTLSCVNRGLVTTTSDAIATLGPSVSIDVDRTLFRTGDSAVVSWEVEPWTNVDPNAQCTILGLQDTPFMVGSASGSAASSALDSSRTPTINCTIFGVTYTDQKVVEVTPSFQEI